MTSSSFYASGPSLNGIVSLYRVHMSSIMNNSSYHIMACAKISIGVNFCTPSPLPFVKNRPHADVALHRIEDISVIRDFSSQKIDSQLSAAAAESKTRWKKES